MIFRLFMALAAGTLSLSLFATPKIEQRDQMPIRFLQDPGAGVCWIHAYHQLLVAALVRGKVLKEGEFISAEETSALILRKRISDHFELYQRLNYPGVADPLEGGSFEEAHAALFSDKKVAPKLRVELISGLSYAPKAELSFRLHELSIALAEKFDSIRSEIDFSSFSGLEFKDWNQPQRDLFIHFEEKFKEILRDKYKDTDYKRLVSLPNSLTLDVKSFESLIEKELLASKLLDQNPAISGDLGKSQVTPEVEAMLYLSAGTPSAKISHVRHKLSETIKKVLDEALKLGAPVGVSLAVPALKHYRRSRNGFLLNTAPVHATSWRIDQKIRSGETPFHAVVVYGSFVAETPKGPKTFYRVLNPLSSRYERSVLQSGLEASQVVISEEHLFYVRGLTRILLKSER